MALKNLPPCSAKAQPEADQRPPSPRSPTVPEPWAPPSPASSLLSSPSLHQQTHLPLDNDLSNPPLSPTLGSSWAPSFFSPAWWHLFKCDLCARLCLLNPLPSMPYPTKTLFTHHSCYILRVGAVRFSPWGQAAGTLLTTLLSAPCSALWPQVLVRVLLAAPYSTGRALCHPVSQRTGLSPHPACSSRTPPGTRAPKLTAADLHAQGSNCLFSVGQPHPHNSLNPDTVTP